MMDSIKFEYTGTFAWDWWVVCRHPKFGLVAAQLGNKDKSRAEQVAKTVENALLLVHVGHMAYNMVGPGFMNDVANRVIEVASEHLDMSYEDDPNVDVRPKQWKGA